MTLETLNQPLVFVVFFAFAEAFFVTGYFFLGLGLMAISLNYYSAGELPIAAIFVGSALGTYSGSVTNYFVSKTLSDRWLNKYVKRSRKLLKASEFLERWGLFIFVLAFRFSAYTRPIYSLVLGTLPVSKRRYVLIELAASLIWAGFWSIVLFFGAETFIDFYLLIKLSLLGE